MLVVEEDVKGGKEEGIVKVFAVEIMSIGEELGLLPDMNLLKGNYTQCGDVELAIVLV